MPEVSKPEKGTGAEEGDSPCEPAEPGETAAHSTGSPCEPAEVEKETMPDRKEGSPKSISLHDINAEQLLNLLKRLYFALDQICKGQTEPGKYALFRSLCAAAGILSPFLVYLIVVVVSTGSVGNLEGFVKGFPIWGYALVLFVLFVVASFVIPSKGKSYCWCFVNGVKFIIVIGGVTFTIKGMLS